MIVLRHIQSSQTRLYPLSKALTLIGCTSDADIVVEGKGIPGVALKVEKTAQTYQVINAESSSKILLNGKKLKTASLRPGDILSVFSEVLVADHDTPAAPAPVQASLDSATGTGQYLRYLDEFSQAAAGEKDLNILLERILKTLCDITQGTEAILFTLDGDKNPIVSVYHGLKKDKVTFSDSVIQDVLKSGRGMAIASALDDPKYSQAQSIVNLKLNTVLCAPIQLAGSITGLIYIGCRKPQISYNDTHLQTLRLYALIAGMLIHNVDYISRQQESIRRLAGAEQGGGLIAGSPVMQSMLEQLKPVVNSDISILLQGETGTGKDVIANYIHNTSGRAKGEFVAVNCSSLRGELLESELFGYKQGAFTGAVKDRKGLFQAAHGGTIFLDEIGEMDMALQAKLLRVLETGKARPVGAVKEEAADVRVLCATVQNLNKMVEEGKFRQDLYYRLAQVTVELPPLRKRGEDILLLAYYYLEKFRARYPHKEIKDIHPDTVNALMSQPWPGNVRELVNVIHRSFLSSPGAVLKMKGEDFEHKFKSLDEATQDFQKQYLSRALALAGGNRENAAKMLNMSRSTFFRYLSQLEVT